MIGISVCAIQDLTQILYANFVRIYLVEEISCKLTWQYKAIHGVDTADVPVPT